jgi:hypothetical protein
MALGHPIQVMDPRFTMPSTLRWTFSTFAISTIPRVPPEQNALLFATAPVILQSLLL